MAEETSNIAKIVLSAVDETGAVFRSVSSQLKGLGQSTTAIGAAFAGLGAQITGALSVAGVTAFVKTVAGGLDALNDLRDATGSSVENLSALEDVAERTGTSFETVGTALVKFNGALNDAKPGSNIANILQSIGLSAAELKRQDPAEALRQVAVAFARYADDGGKARAVQELFGRSLREVAPLLADLAKQGSLTAKVTTEQAEAAERFQHALDNLAKNSKDAARALVGDLLPALTRTIESFNKFGGLGGTAKAVIGQDEMSRLQKLANDQAAQLRRLNDAVSANQNIIDDPQRSQSEVSRAERRLEQIRAKLKEVSAQALATTDAIKGVTDKVAPNAALRGIEDRGFTPDPAKLPDFTPNEALQKYIESLEKATVAELGFTTEEKARYDILSGALGKLTEESEQRVLALARGVDLLKAKFQSLDDFRKSEITQRNETSGGNAFFLFQQQQAEAASKAVAALIAQTKQGQINELTKQYSALQDAFDAGAITAQQYADVLENLDEQFGKLTAPVQHAAEQISEFTKQAQRNIQDALGDSLVALLDGKFESIGKLWGDLLKRMIAQALAARLNEALFGKDFSGGLIGPALTGLLGAFGGARAMGGDVQAGSSYLVGERGPELFTPQQSGSITPNSAIGGGVTIVQHNYIGSGVTRNDVALAMYTAEQRAVAAVADASRRARSVA
jgi:hypothetical protein